MSLPAVAEALRRLARRGDVRAARRTAEDAGVPVRVVGGAVRDAFLARSGGDLDLALSARHAPAFAAALAERLGTRAVPIGERPRRIFRVPWRRGEIDVWEGADDPVEDELRRDFTVNALSYELPSGRFSAPEGALADLGARRLRPPRPGVYLEDPLRVLRAARFEAELPGFRLSHGALSEIRRASAHLPGTAPERRLAELDRILACNGSRAAAGLMSLERWGALGALLPGASGGERRKGIRLLSRSPGGNAAVAWALLLRPLEKERVGSLLEALRVPRRVRRLVEVLHLLPLRRRAGFPARREVVTFVRTAAPFLSEAIAFASAAGRPAMEGLLAATRPLTRRPRVLARILRPKRPLDAPAVARLLGLSPGPELGAALQALDVALASGEVRGEAAARRFLSRRTAR